MSRQESSRAESAKGEQDQQKALDAMFGTIDKHQELVETSKLPMQRAKLLKRSSMRLK